MFSLGAHILNTKFVAEQIKIYTLMKFQKLKDTFTNDPYFKDEYGLKTPLKSVYKIWFAYRHEFIEEEYVEEDHVVQVRDPID